jgi:hypothetical protein
MASDIKSFDKKGGTRVVRQRSNLKSALDPKPIRARLSENGGVRGGSVKVTNPAYGVGSKKNQRTASMGAKGVGQRGRSVDF